MPKNSIPAALQSLLADLDFLSQIKRNMKPCCNDRVLVDADSWSGAFYRFFKGENRQNVISKVEQIVNNAVEAIENQKYNEHISLTINALYNASNGITNLAYTYENDPNMKAKINVQLKNIEIQLVRFRHLIKGYQEVKDTDTKDIIIDVNSLKEKEKETETIPSVETINLLDSGSLDFEKKKFRKPLKLKKPADNEI